MKNPTLFKHVLVVLLLLFSLQSISQNYQPFSVRKKVDIKGGMLVIGNNILGKDNLGFNDDTKDNQDISMQYIDIDGDASTFSSSSANLVVPAQKNGNVTTCYKVAYAALYWGAVLQSGSRTDINKVKLKLPGSTVYNDIIGQIVYDAIATPIVSLPNEPGNTPYACYADVTTLLSGLSNMAGDYTVANVRSSLGFNAGTGLSAGWTLYVIYEDPLLSTKSFTSFDGFSHVSSSHTQSIPISGFNTPQTGPVDFQVAYAALDGDKTKRATKLELNGKEITTPLRGANKFFGSVIENGNGITHPRNPFGSNTLGYDTGFLNVYSANPSFITNNATSADLTIQVAKGQADPIFFFFSAFSVDIIAPEITMTKIVLDTAGNNIDGADVSLGQNLFYKISYQSTGNDNVTQFTIKDVLPDNVIFNPATDLDLSNSGGATLQSYDPATRTLIFNIPNSSVEINDPIFEIRIAVKIVSECYALSQACSNEIKNQAYATYRGVRNTTLIQDEGSFNSVACLGTPAPTNFLVNINNCTFERNEVLCGSSVVLTAASGYDSYSWSRNPSGTPVIGTGQTYTALETGAYYVKNTIASTCISIEEKINVIPYGNTVTNPVIPFADLLPTCPNDGKVLPTILLCGANATKLISTGISDATSIIWEKLDETSCPPLGVNNCANENSACTWNQVGTGPNYLSNTSGQFRVVINYTGGCFSIFYFNVYQNLLNPTATVKDIICNTPGQITVGGVPSGYEYSIDGTNWQSSNIFTINTPNYYVIYIRQVGVNTNPCIFQTPSTYVRQRNFTVSTFISQPYCNGGQGSVKLAANDALPQYYYSISQGATLINSVGPIADSDYTFANLNPGTYTYTVSTDDGCTFTDNIVITNPALLTATVALTKPLTCTDGELTVYPNGGTAPFEYFVNSATVSQDSPIISVSTPGVYDITVIDFNNCSTSTSITVNATPPPVFNITKTDILCSGSGNTGSININVTNANGNSLLYSIDNGATFVSSPTFTGLADGNYEVVVQYTTGPDACTSTPQTINIATLPAVTATSTLTTPYTCLTTGIITVSGVSGGTAPYTYSINGVTFQPGLTFSGLTNGSYTVTVRDANGCTFNTNAINIAPLTPPTDLTFSSSALTCPTNTSTVTITGTTGGFGALEYQIIAPAGAVTAYQSSNTFSGLAPNTYTFQVKDANECVYNESYTISPLPALTVVGQLINDVTCFGGSDGSVRYTVSGTSGFTYTINGGASIAGTSPINLTGLAAGSYAINITDTTTNCQATASVTVNQPVAPLGATTTASPITCNTNGSVVINASGGWGGYSYSLTQPDASVLPTQGSNTFNNLTQVGTYIATVTDSRGCVVTSSFALSTPGIPTASISAASNFCYDGVTGASLIVNASGGQTPYEYNINGGPYQVSNTFNNLVPGNYTINVRDAYGCIFPLPVQTIAAQLIVNTVLTKELDCTASPNAVITGTIAGGYAPFTYEVSINSGAYASLGSTGTPFTYSTATAATYQFRITDARNCQSVSNVININPITNPTVSATTTNVSCNGASDGTAQLVGSGGSGGYTFSDDNVTFTATSLFTGLSNGSHTFYVRDNKSCTSSVTVNITQPTPLVATASATAFSCSVTNAKQSAVITIAVPTTGTAPYQYSFNNGATFSSSNTLTVNDNGADQTFTYVVRDANGCLTVAQNITLARLNPPTDLAFTSAAVTCTATTTTVTVTATNGVGALQYETIAPSPVIIAKQGSNLFAGLAPGTYVFQVTDANGCYYSESYTIAPVTPIAITGTLVSDVLCKGDSTGSGAYNVSGNATVGNYTFTLTAGTLGTGTLTQSGDVLTLSNVAVGTYTVQVTDSATGCVANASITVSEPANPLTLAVTSNINANCFNRAQVTVAGSGGTPNYTYAFVQDGANPAGLYTSSNTATLDPIVNTNWDVWVMDNQGCTTKLDVVIATDAVPTINPVALQCYTGTPISITLSGTAVGTPTYSIGGSFQASPTFSINAPGIYNVSIRDGNGCIATRTFELRPELLLAADLTQDLTCTVDASIALTASGGTGVYATYEVSYNSGAYAASGSTYTATVDGNYQFRVTDSQGCQAISNVIIVTPKTTPTQTFTQTNVSCNGNSDGSIVVTAANGIAPYQYSIDNGATFQASNVFNGLASGTYNIVVRDSKSCISVATVVTITQPTPLVATASATAFSCSVTNAKQSAVITIAVPTTGTAPYQYSFNNGATFSSSNTLTVNDNGADQTFTYVVRDANGCLTVAQNITLARLNPPTDLAFTSAAVTCTATTTTVTVTATNGVGALQYETIAPSPVIIAKQGSNLFAGLAPGTYVFQVTDANGCYYSESYTIAPVTPIAITGTLVSDVLCKGDSTGSGTYNVSGNATVGNYTFTLTAGTLGTGTLTQSGDLLTLSNVAVGTYTVQVTDSATGCVANASIIVSEPANPLTLSVTSNVNANCFNRAQVTVSGSGGTPNYTYAFVQDGANPAGLYTSSNTATLDPIVNTNWDVWVMDNQGCTTKLDVVIATDAVPTINPVALQCYTGTPISITLSGTAVGTPTYSIGGSYQASPTFSINAPGIYNVSIRDGNGCIASRTFELRPELLLDANMTQDLTCAVDASITLTASGGTGVYATYEVSYNSGAYAASGSTYTATVDGNYQFRVTDSQGCQAISNVIIVTPKTTPTQTFTQTNVSCNGNSDGSIVVTAANGIAPYQYSIDNGATFQASNVFNGLASGTYNIVVRDSKSCISVATVVTITQPTPLVATASATAFSCSVTNAKQSAVITIAVPTTGTAPYQYSFNNGATFSSSNTLTVNDNGADQTFTYVVRDANGCLTVAQNITLARLNPPTDLAFTSAAVTCTATTTTVTVTATNGVGALQYETIAPSPVIIAKQGSNLFAGLAPGTYVFQVTDANGCYYSESYTIAPVTPIALTGLKLSDVLCNAGNSGAIQFTVSGYAGTYTSVLTSGVGTLSQVGNTVNLTGLIADTYTLEVTDDITGCTATYTITISEPTPLTFGATATNVFCTNDESQITVTAAGGTVSYTYAAVISGNPAPLAAAYGSSNVITVDTNLASDLVWDIYVKDANGCIEMNTVAIISDALPTVTTPPLASNQCTVSNGFTFIATGTGLAPLTYSINGVTFQSSPTFTVNAPGSYTVTIKDKNGCTATSPTPTIVYAPLDTNAILTKDLTCSVPTDATINVTTTGGNAPYSYEVSFNGGAYAAIAGSPYSATSPGTYQFRITDANTCTRVTNVITVAAIVPVTASDTSVDPTCNGDADGSIRLTALSGEAPFTYSIDNGVTFVASNVFGGLVAGTYNYVVRDAKGCELPGSITLNNPAPIVPNIIVNGIQCGPVVPGSFDIDITSGGTAPYTYKLYNNSFTEIDTYTSTALPASFPHSFTNLNFGDYYITIVDAIGCEYNSASLRIEPAPYLNLTSSIATASCATGVDVTLNVSGGVPNYDYSIFGQPATSSGSIAAISYTFTGLDQGTTYVFQVIDSNGCPSYLEITTPIISPIIIDPLTVTNVTCFGANNGEISFTVDLYDLSTTDLYYEVRDNLTNTAIIPATNGHLTGLTGLPASAIITGLPAGNYTLYVREFDGVTLCSTTREFQIRQPIQALASVISAEVNANCNSGTQITLTTTGGTGPYKYAAGAPGFIPVALDFGASNVLNLDDAIRLNWDIVIEDANGCQVRINKTITRDADPTIDPVALQCFTGTPISITLSGTTSVGPVTYSIGTGGVAGSYQSSPTFSINAAGTYDVFIKDGNGCIATTTYVVQPALLLDADLTKELDCTVSPNAVITLTPSGGTGIYSTYEVDYNGGGYVGIAGSPYSAVSDGTYQFRVTDSQGCQSVSNIITIDPVVNPTHTFTQTNVSCNGGSDGSIVVTAAGGVAPYQYSIDNGLTFQASNVFTGLNVAGVYNVVVIDSKSCVSPATLVTITEPALVGGTIALTQGLTCGAGNATQAAIVTVTGSGGTAPYTYSFDGGVNYTSTNTYSTYTAGLVTAYIKDANGCLIPVALTENVPALDPPTDLAFSATAVTCIALTSDVQLTTTNGTLPLSYAILSPAAATGNVTGAASGLFTGLAPDTYMFEVTDANGCTYQESYTVVPVTNITIAGLKLNDVYCFGDNTGAIEFTVSDYAGTYTTTILSGAGTLVQAGNTIDFTDLIADTYTIRVTDDITGCTADATIIVTEPASALTFTATTTNVYCTNDESQITVTASGGTASYTYAAVRAVDPAPLAAAYGSSNVVTVDTNSGADLVWNVYVKDVNGCITMNPVTVILDPLPTVDTPPLASNQCTVSSGFTFTAFGETGVGPFTYSINGGASYQASPTFTVNAPGTYTVTIRDANGCTAASATATVVYAPLNSVITLTKELDCTVSPDAVITGTITGGLAPYTYEVSINGTPYAALGAAVTPYTYTTASSGTYQFRITDANSCQVVSNIITIDPVVNPTHTFTQTNVSCNGGSDGSIVVTAAGGVAPYQYSIDNGLTFQASNVFTGLNVAGVYNVVVIDSKSCVSPATLVTITEPALVGGTIALTQGLTCGAGNATQAAIVTVTGSGGTAPYTYSFDGGVNYTSTNTYSTYTAGLVTAYIKDANGCLIPVALTENVPALDPPTDLAFSATAVTCIALTSDVQLTTTNGTLPLSYAILSPAAATGNVTGAASGLFTGLAPDTYMFEVTDANGCTYQESYTVVPVTNITIAGLKLNDVYCFGDNTGAIEFTVSDYAGTYTTTILSGAGTLVQAGNTIDFTDLIADTYTIRVTDDITGCTADATIIVTEPASALTFTATTTNVYCTNDESQITVTASGGTASYTYAAVRAVDPAPLAAAYGSSNVVTVDTNSGADLVWNVYVKDVNGCITMNPVTVILDPLPTVDTPPLASNQCTVSSGFTFTAFGETGVGPFTYSINGGASYQASPTFTVNAPGTYTVTIRDANGCTAASATATVVYAPLNSVITLTKELDCTVSPDAVITGTITGGLAPYTYEVSINGTPYAALGAAVTPYTYTTASSGTYQFRITDANSCQVVSNIITIDPVVNPTHTFTQTNVSCNGGSDGSIVVTAAGGVAPYQYSIDNGLTFQASNVFTGLNVAGVYNVVVIDSKSCVSPATLVTITEPALVGGTIALTQGLTCGAGNATQAAIVTVTGSGGTAPYTYSFDGGVNYTSTNTYSTYTAGLVTAYIKDANGCLIPVALTENVPALDPPTDLAFSATAVTCIALTSDVQLTTTNGTLPLSYAILSPAAATGNVTGAASGLFTGLAPDTYMFEVTDANGCTYQESYTVVPVTNITIAGLKLNDVYCFGDNTGAIEFTVSDYAGTYTTTILSGAGTLVQAGNTIDFTDLIADTYTIRVTDDITGCTADATIIVTEPASALTFTATTTNVYCTNDESQITVTASGGTASYTYAAVVSGALAPAPAAYGNSNVVTVDTNSGADLVWDVYVRDANGCTEMNTVTVILDPMPTVTVPAMASNQCNLTGDPYSFTITGSSGIAPLTYSVGSGFQASGTFTGLTPGNYFVTVKDGNGCEAISPTSVTIYAPLDFTPTITALPTCANNDGVITVSQSGGSGTYTYAISPSVGSLSGNVFSGVPSGTYTITITDTVTSCTKDVSITLTAATPVTFTTSVDAVSCNGGNDGIITVSLPLSNNNPIYTYQIIAGPMLVPVQNSNIFSGLIAGNYTVQVNSGRGCSTTAVVSVGEPTPLTVSGTATPFGCAPDNSVNTSTVTITEVGGTAPYVYSIDGVSYLTTNIFNIIDTGVSQTINIYVKDANGCLNTNTVVIAPLPTLTAATVGIATPIDCNNTGSVAITVTGGSGNFTYQLLPSGVAQASNIFNITLPGNYYFQVNDTTTGCTIATSAFTVAPFDTINVVATATTPVTCFGDNNGAFEINVTGYTGTYNYQVFDNSGAPVGGIVAANTSTNPQVITGLSGGSYTVTVTETASPFCTEVSNTVTIASPASALTLLASETSNVTCTNDKGTITAIASGGWGTYVYELTGTSTVAYSANGTFTNLSAGNYTVNARDARGCIVSVNVTLTIPVPINATVTPSTTLLSCFGDTNATITVSAVTGGQGSNYSYTLNSVLPTVSTSGPQASPIFSGLGAGTYNVVITDGYNCQYTSATIVIAQPTVVQSQLVKTTSQTCLTGTTLTLSATGGTAPYTFSNTASFATVLGSFATSTTINVTPGTYVYYVRDANGCVANVSNQIKIDPLPPLVVNLTLANAFINCAGDNTGVIVAVAQGGLGNYIYTLQDALGNNIPAVQASPGIFTQLFAGDYQVRVVSVDCNITSSLISITEPAAPLIAPFTYTDVTCNGSNNGTIVINASGGTGQIKYAISPQLNQFFVSNIFNNLAPGTYDVIAQDQLGCFVVSNITISEPSPLALNIVPGSLIPEVCTGDMDGEFSIDMSGGTAPYSVSLDDYNGVYTIGTLAQTQFDFIGLSGGDHMVYVRDNLGCESEWNITFPESVILDPVAVVNYGCTNNISSNTVTVTVDASITNPSDIDYSLDGGTYQASNIFSDVVAGMNHFIDVRHTNGCIKRTNTFDITAYAPLTLVLNDGGINEIVTVTAGGSSSYEYSLNGENYGSSNSFIIYKSGDYTVTVTDRNGCIASATRYFDYIDVCIPNYFTPNGDGIEDGWGPGCTINYKDLTVDVMDRYGRKVDVLRVGEKWDGKYRGKELPTGDYWYVLKLNDKKDKRSFVGHFTLYR